MKELSYHPSSPRSFLNVLALAIGPLLVSACLVHGTGTGNPAKESHSGTGDPAPSVPNEVQSAKITDDVCMKVVSCHPQAQYLRCTADVMELRTYAPKLGVSLEPSPSVLELANLEANGMLIIDWPALEECRRSIRQVDCSSESAQNAYIPESQSPYAGTVELLSPICENVYSLADESAH